MNRFIAIAVVVFLTMTSVSVYAERPSRSSEELLREAFLRGGSAISEALNDATSPNSIVATDLIPAAAPKPPMPSAQATEGKHRRAMTLVGVAIIGTIAIYLVQRSVKNHGKVFGSN